MSTDSFITVTVGLAQNCDRCMLLWDFFKNALMIWGAMRSRSSYSRNHLFEPHLL
ncbi:MAG: hypothetical protein V7K27_24115 [Nostoc sp.]|uniref:hypothetical protein n=1 Tax=Nostoc sp. TaxID=1180 RepID=UPI002FF559DB